MIRKNGKTIRRLKKLRLYFSEPRYVENSGIKLSLTHPGISDELRRALYLDPYERHEWSIIEKKLEKDDVVLELGAGIGFISTQCALRVGSENVHALEANPEMITAIEETYRLNGVSPNLTCGMLGHTTGDSQFFQEQNFISSSALKRSPNAVAVQTKRYDAAEFISAIRPTFLICDIEGGEKELFDCLNLDCVKKLCIELHPHIVGSNETSKIFRILLNAGFVCEFLLSSERVFYFERTESLSVNIEEDTNR